MMVPVHNNLNLNSPLSAFVQSIVPGRKFNPSHLTMLHRKFGDEIGSPKLDPIKNSERYSKDEIKDLLILTGFFASNLSNILTTKKGGYTKENLQKAFQTIDSVCSIIFSTDLAVHKTQHRGYLDMAISAYTEAREHFISQDDTNNKGHNSLIMFGTLFLFAIRYKSPMDFESGTTEAKLDNLRTIEDVQNTTNAEKMNNGAAIYEILKKDLLSHMNHASIKSIIEISDRRHNEEPSREEVREVEEVEDPLLEKKSSRLSVIMAFIAIGRFSETSDELLNNVIKTIKTSREESAEHRYRPTILRALFTHEGRRVFDKIKHLDNQDLTLEYIDKGNSPRTPFERKFFDTWRTEFPEDQRLDDHGIIGKISKLAVKSYHLFVDEGPILE